MKKIILSLILLFAVSSMLFAKPFSVADLATDKLSDYDIPLIDAIVYFLDSFKSFARIATTLAIAFGFIGIIWNAVKMMFGSENTRKIALDIMAKFLIYTLVMTFYPKIIFGVLDTATTIGMFAGDGYSKINAQFMLFRKNLEQDAHVAELEMNNLLSSAAAKNKDIRISPDLARTMVNRYSTPSPEEQKQIIAELGPKYNIIPDEVYRFDASNASEVDNYLKYVDDTNYKHGITTVYSDLKKLNKEIHGKDADRIAKATWDDPAVQHSIISLKAMNEILTPNPEYNKDFDDVYLRYSGNKISYIPKYLFDPFIKSKDGKQSKLLSPGSMIKTGIVIADIINYQMLHEFDTEGNIVDKAITVAKDGASTTLLRSIQETVYSFFFSLGTVAACVFFAIQYCMCIFEYFIITSVGIIFVPCVLWDGTKSFAAKLTTLFLSYFFKLMLMIFCLFWAYSALLQMGMNMMKQTGNIFSLLNIGLFIFTILLCWIVTQNGPKLATTLLNGTPDLSMGEFLRAAGTAAAGAYAAKKAFSGAANTISGTGKAAHKGLQTAGRTFAGLDAMSRGVSEAVNAQGDIKGWNKDQRASQYLGGMAGLIGQNIKNSASTFVTGVENTRDNTKGISSFSKGSTINNKGVNGTQTKQDAQNGAKEYMNKKFNNDDSNVPNNDNSPSNTDNNLPANTNNNSPQNNTLNFNGDRDTNA